MCSANALHCKAHKQPKAQHVAEYRCHPCHGNGRDRDRQAGHEMETQQMRIDIRKAKYKQRATGRRKSEIYILRQVGERGGKKEIRCLRIWGLSDVWWINAD